MSRHSLPTSAAASLPSSSPSSPSRQGATGPNASDSDTASLYDALVQWVASFASSAAPKPQASAGLSRPCKHMTDLADGVLLFEVAAQVDKDWFRLIGTLEHTPTPTPTSTSSPSAHWIPRYNNLKKLHRLLISYLTDVLGMADPTPTRPILLDKIARHADADQLAHLTSLLLVVAVHSPATPHVIARIQQLETRVQATLMQVIEGYLVQLQQGSRGGSPAPTPGATGEEVVSQAQVAQLLMEKRQIEARHRQLQQDYDVLASEYEAAATMAFANTHARSKAAAGFSATSTDNLHGATPDTPTSPTMPASTSSLSQPSSSTTSAAVATGTLTADLTIARAEIARLHTQLAHAEEARHDLEITHANQARMLADQARRLADLADQAALVRTLRDQVDELRDASVQAARAQAQVEKLKARLVEVHEAKRQVKEAQEEAVRLKAQVARYEAELMGRAKAGGGGAPGGDGIEEVERSERKAAREWEARFLALQEQHARVVAEVERVREVNGRLEDEVGKERERVGELVDQVKELEEQQARVVGGESLSSSLAQAAAAGKQEPTADAEEERAMLVAEVAALRAQVAELRQEREAMHAQFEGHKQLLAKARALIVQANKERAEMVEQHAAELTKVKSLASTSAAAAAAAAADQTAKGGKDVFPEAIQALQLQIEGYQRETQALWAENKALRDQWRREQAWMASAWYRVVSAKASGVGVAGGSMTAAGATAGASGAGQVGNTWLAQQRRLLSEHIMKQF